MAHASLCFLSFNRPQFLPRAISTAVEGAGEPVEVIVHDDGSGDKTLTDYLYDAVRLGMVSRLILNPCGHNEGQGVALNRMWGMATGDLLLKLDHDMTFNAGWLQRVREIMRENEIRSVPCATRMKEDVPLEPRIGLLGLFHYHHEPVDSAKTVLQTFDGWSSHTHICGSAYAMPREAWEELGPYSEHSDAFAEDYEMQRAVTDSERWCCALPAHDLAANHGFGVGPSTVVTAPDTVQGIHHGPFLVTP